METVWCWLTQVILEKWPFNERRRRCRPLVYISKLTVFTYGHLFSFYELCLLCWLGGWKGIWPVAGLEKLRVMEWQPD